MSYYFQVSSWGERFIPEVNRYNFVKVCSSDFYDSNLEFDLKAEDTLHVVIGSDSGLLLKYLHAKTLGHGSAVFIIEDDEVFPYVAEECADILQNQSLVDSTTPVEKIRFCSASEWQSSLFDEKEVDWCLGGRFDVFQSEGSRTDSLQRYFALFRKVRVEVLERKRRVSLETQGQIFIINQILNAADNVVPVPLSSVTGENRVAVVLAGGPSLDDHLQWVLDNREKLFVLIVSRLCQQMDDIGLVPDIVVSIDPKSLMFDYSKHGTLWEKVPLVCNYHVAPQLLQQWRGPHYYIGERLPWDGIDTRSTASMAPMGSTVGHVATVLAYALGFSTVLMAGLDLCYSLEGTTHADGSPESALLALPSRYDAQIATYSGRIAGTSYPLLRSYQSMLEIGASVNDPEPVLYNISSEAAAIETIPFIDVNSVELLHPAPVMDIPSYAPTRKTLTALKEQFKKDKREFRAIIKLCKQANTYLNRIYGNREQDSGVSYSAKLDLLEKKLNAKKRYLNVILHFHNAEFNAIRKPSGFEHMDKRALEKWGREYYNLIKKSAENILTFIRVSELSIGVRESELDPDQDIASLIALWKNSKCPGRILMYRDNNYQQLDQPEQELLDKAAEEYIDFVFADRNAHITDVQKMKDDMGYSIGSVVFLYNEGSLEDLKILTETITDLTWPNNVVRNFIAGLAFSLEKNYEGAIGEFHQIVDICSEKLQGDESSESCFDNVSRLLEETLSRMTQIFLTLNDGESAQNTLGILCELSSHYVASYARLLNVMGDASSAIHLLTMYQENYPEDWRAAQQLAELYESIGAKNEASIALKQAEKAREEIFSANKRAA